ncbi:putative disease resistance protein [Forsythia ovata]|uniref:Disease resistance protein n=1 Tax=Forsythia ovata TaxID=205694 RepID=A0ABD1V149_9LAMI
MAELLETVTSVVTLLCPDLEENTQTLQRKIELLKSRKVDVQANLQNAGKKRKREVEDWLINVENNITEFETLEQEIQCSRFYSRQKLAERVERMTKEVMELDEQSDFRGGLFLEVDESIGQLMLTPPHNGQAFLQNFDDIWASLMDDNILSIGIYGMGGVGKTTVAMHAHDNLLNEPKFSGHSDIAQALKLDFSCGSDEKKRAAQLFQTFQKRGSFVIILDDVWKQIDAEKIGIPPRRDGCKLVVTSRSKEVCHRMGCQRIIKVNTLSQQEAWELFLKKLGRDELHPEVEEICKKMVKRCGGLPLALVTLAGSMRGVTDTHEWRDASEELKESCMGRADIENEILPILLYSYDRLRDPKLQRCFLYCSLYPEDFSINREELIENFISEELMDRRLSWRAENDQGHAILNQLERACLLERVWDEYNVKMHDLIRDMALGITKHNPRYMVKAGLNLREIPDVQEWTEDLDKISLMKNSIEEISIGMSPNCPRLSTLILSHNPLKSIPDCFFTQMRGLRTLNLSRTSIQYLPHSISDLENLKTLLLKHCSSLKSVPTLEKLRLLTWLDLSCTKIEELPDGVESLTNLKVLDLFRTSLSMIPTGVLHSLYLLQQLRLPIHIGVPIEEVLALKQLEDFCGSVNSVSDFNRLITFLQSMMPPSFYTIFLISKFDKQSIWKASRRKSVCFEQGSLMDFSLGEGKILLPRDIEHLRFSRSGLSGSLADGFQMLNNARCVKMCNVQREDEIECIIRLSSTEKQQSRRAPFQSLEKLSLLELPNFTGLFTWEGKAAVAPLLPGIFTQLTDLKITRCNKMKTLIPWSLLQTLPNLQKWGVASCKEIEEIIGDEDDDGSLVINSSAEVTMPRLKNLRLVHLPKLKSIYKGMMICNSIENIIITKCTNLKKVAPLDGQPSPPPSLKEILVYAIEKKWWESLEWEHPNANNFLQPFVKFDPFWQRWLKDLRTVPSSMDRIFRGTWLGALVNISNMIPGLIEGNLPKELGMLKSLREVILWENQFSGFIPKELGNCTNLEMLALYQNNLVEEIPAELGNLMFMQKLYLYRNGLNGTIPREIGNLTQAVEIDFSENYLTGEIPTEFSQIKGLKLVYLFQNDLVGVIPNELSSLKYLTKLDLSINHLTGPIPFGFQYLAELYHLLLFSNSLTGSIPQRFGLYSRLWVSNKLYGNIPAGVISCISLQQLRLSGNRLTGSFPSDLCKLPNLAAIELGQNKFSGPTPQEVGKCQKLQRLDLSGIQFTSELPKEIGNLSQLCYRAHNDFDATRFCEPVQENISYVGSGDCGSVPFFPASLKLDLNHESGINNKETVIINEGEDALLRGSEQYDVPDSRQTPLAMPHCWQNQEDSAIEQCFWKPLTAAGSNEDNEIEDKQEHQHMNSRNHSKYFQEPQMNCLERESRLYGELEAIYKRIGTAGSNQTGSGSVHLPLNTHIPASEASIGEEESMKMAKKRRKRKKMKDQLDSMANLLEITLVVHPWSCLLAKLLNIIAPRFNRFKNYISQALKIGISKESDEKKRAAELFQTVKNKGKFVLILDDVSK